MASATKNLVTQNDALMLPAWHPQRASCFAAQVASGGNPASVIILEVSINGNDWQSAFTRSATGPTGTGHGIPMLGPGLTFLKETTGAVYFRARRTDANGGDCVVTASVRSGRQSEAAIIF